MKQLPLYPFSSASIKVSAATIFPPIYIVTVEGTTDSLDPTIELVDTKQTENDYLVVNVEGKDGLAIGSMQYKKTINVQQAANLKGVLVKGEGKEQTLEWSNTAELTATAGLFHLPLQSSSQLLGAPTINLQLGVDTVNETASGIATVHQSTRQGTVCTSEVKGKVIYEYTMDPKDSKIRIDLTGYPNIHWPPHGGVGPVILPNLKATILLDTDWSSGTIMYQYMHNSGWVHESQDVHLQSNAGATNQSSNQKLAAVG